MARTVPFRSRLCSATGADATDAPRDVAEQAPAHVNPNRVEAGLLREPACPSGGES